jgi:pimeloyl-ACP methyl ester carboxylesterase
MDKMMIALNSKQFPNTYYKKIGNGPSVLLIHGFGEDATIWSNQIAYLQDQYTVVIPDLPGSGKSNLPSTEISIELLADFVFEIVEQEQIRQVILLGHSMGGYITAAFAKKYPDRLLGIGFIHSSVYADDDLKKETRLKSIQLIERGEEEKIEFLKIAIPNLYAEHSKLNRKPEIQQHLTNAFSISSSTLIAYTKAMMLRPDNSQLLTEWNKPVLFVVGNEDKAVPPKDNFKQSALSKDCSIYLLTNVGHMSMVEDADQLNKIINRFLEYVLQHKIV